MMMHSETPRKKANKHNEHLNSKGFQNYFHLPNLFCVAYKMLYFICKDQDKDEVKCYLWSSDSILF